MSASNEAVVENDRFAMRYFGNYRAGFPNFTGSDRLYLSPPNTFGRPFRTRKKYFVFAAVAFRNFSLPGGNCGVLLTGRRGDDVRARVYAREIGARARTFLN